MAKKSRDKIIEELEIRKISYSEEMTDDQLADLLKEAIKKEKADEKKAEEAHPVDPAPPAEIPLNVDYGKARCGLATIHDHEYRLCVIEQRIVRKLFAAIAEVDRKIEALG